jgi:amino acid permease
MKPVSESTPIIGAKVTREGGSTALQSVLNMVKICIGTGTLALPFATSEGK